MWYRQAVFYGIAAERFADSNGDGIGDFPGLTAKLPYLAELGVDCVWLLPIHPSSGGDNGYDVTDYYGIDPRFGRLEDFVKFVRSAAEHGIRVVIDLVAEHTSDRHPWFQAARQDEHSRYRDYYVWSQHPLPVGEHQTQAFPGEESSVWTYDETARAFYYH